MVYGSNQRLAAKESRSRTFEKPSNTPQEAIPRTLKKRFFPWLWIFHRPPLGQLRQHRHHAPDHLRRLRPLASPRRPGLPPRRGASEVSGGRFRRREGENSWPSEEKTKKRWLRSKNGSPQNGASPGKWKHALRPAVFWWFDFDPYPYGRWGWVIGRPRKRILHMKDVAETRLVEVLASL